MGLIDFIKGAGEKLFGADEPSAEEKAANREASEKKASDALENVVRKMGIPISDLDIDFSKGVARISGKTETQEAAEKAVLTVGNIRGVSQVNNLIVVSKPEPEAVYYTVQSGDSLSKIARAQYGDAMKYPAIFEANKPMLKDPDKIYPGQVLRIPAIG